MVRVPLKDICDKITDGSHNPPTGVLHSNYLMISSKNIDDDYISLDSPRYLSEEDFKNENRRTNIRPNDLLMTIVGTIGRVAVVQPGMDNLCLQRSVGVLKPKLDIINPRFLMYQIQSMRPLLEKEAHGVAQKGIYLKQVENLSILVPEMEKQKYVAAVLDKVNTLISLRKQQLAKLDELVKVRFVEMFGKCNSFKNLEKFSILITKGASPKWQGVDYADTGTLFVTSENVRTGYVDLEKRKYLDNKINEIQPRSVLQRQDILINIVGASIGRAAIFECDELANINQAVALVRAIPQQIDLKFLITYLNSEKAIELYGKMKKGGARDNLSLKNIAELPIPVVPIELQKQFAAFVGQIDLQKLTIQQSLDTMEVLKKSLMQEYFG